MPSPARLPSSKYEEIQPTPLTVQDMVTFLLRRKAIIFAATAVLLTLCTLWCIFGTKLYRSTGQIQIQKENSDAFGLEGALSGAADSASDALDYNVTLETQANILQSDTLALQVARELKLETTQDFSPRGGFKVPHWLTPWAPLPEPADRPLDQAPVRRNRLLKQFSKRLKVETLSGTRLITISYANPDPQLAAEVVNVLIRDFQEYTFQARYTVTAQASGWLSGQLTDLKKQTEDLQARAISLQRATGMFGDSQDHNIILAKLEELNTAASAAEANRILKEAIYHAVQNRDPELVTNLAGNAPIGSAAPPVMANSLSLIQSLRLQEASIEAELADDQTRLGPEYPKIAELKGQLAGIRSAMQAELDRVRARAESDYSIALEAEQNARQGFDAQKAIALETNDKAIQFGLAKQEADESRDLYEDMLKKLKEAGVLEGLRSTNITVVDQARTPARPSRPYAPVYVPISLGLGIVLGVCAALFIELTDTSVHTVEELEVISQAPVIAVLPLYKMSSGLSLPRLDYAARGTKAGDGPLVPFAASDPGSFYVETVRALRTALLLSRSTLPPRVIKVTSPLAKEGKSTLVMNLGAILAQQGAKVLLVDADLRRPRLHELAGKYSSIGLSTMLSSSMEADNGVLEVPTVPGLYLVPSGPIPPFPAELLGSPRMKCLVESWRQKFDFVLMDSPPLLPVTDSMVLNQFTDFHLLVVRFATTPKAAFRQSYNYIAQQAEPGTLGVVVNAFEQHSQEYQQYYGYTGYTYTSASPRMMNDTVN